VVAGTGRLVVERAVVPEEAAAVGHVRLVREAFGQIKETRACIRTVVVVAGTGRHVVGEDGFEVLEYAVGIGHVRLVRVAS